MPNGIRNLQLLTNPFLTVHALVYVYTRIGFKNRVFSIFNTHFPNFLKIQLIYFCIYYYAMMFTFCFVSFFYLHGQCSNDCFPEDFLLFSGISTSVVGTVSILNISSTMSTLSILNILSTMSTLTTVSTLFGLTTLSSVLDRFSKGLLLLGF